MRNDTKVERTSDLEPTATRTFDAPARLVFQAWSRAELFRRWWVPQSFPIKLKSCEMDVRVGGRYVLVFEAEGQDVPFFGEYLEVVPPTRLSWSSDEGGPEARTITTVTFEERDGKTLVTMTDRHPSKEALDATVDAGPPAASPETFDQLAALLPTLAPGVA